MKRDELFHALSSPCRRQIMGMLRQQNMSAGEIAQQFDISQPSVSRHLEVLKKAEVVTTERRANQVIYSLNMIALQEVVMYATELLAGQEAQQND